MSQIFVGDTPLKAEYDPIEGKFVEIDGQAFYRITNYNQMRPFFMTLVSHSDHWMFISSNGGLSAGRKDENSALFPYYTDDKITDGQGHTGPLTIIRVHRDDRMNLWQPFSDKFAGAYTITRSIYKNTLGNHLIFEEVNSDLGLQWQYSWRFSEKYGFVRKCSLSNLGESPVTIDILDGFQNILPFGVGSTLQNNRSNLANAYKRSELEHSSGIGIFALSSMIVDKAEPSEALGATIAWQYGIVPQYTLLSTLQLDSFRFGHMPTEETDIKAERGAYLLGASLSVDANGTLEFYTVTDVNKDRSDIALIRAEMLGDINLAAEIEEDIAIGSAELRALVAMADGLQHTEDKMSVTRHYSNVLFNIMRGGIFEDQYVVYKDDLIDYFKVVNMKLVKERASFFDGLPETIPYQLLIDNAYAQHDPDLIRIVYEYLPLSFSRRHGDPSRPWNKFRIDGKNRNGSRNKYYEGNWRDIFQNWEALSLSFPDFIVSMITKFVNASTIDGYNPYRITRNGIDWEVIEPDDPWSYIGYWGDHQIIYLLKLLENLRAHQPGKLTSLLSEEHFVFANVPYRIKSYANIVNNPQDTIDFDHEIERETEKLVSTLGSDGKLIHLDNTLLQVNLVEKLLLTLLTKVSNFVPDAGIWMNTQRPEWNDANNALVGNGASMVTLCYLYRYVNFLKDMFADKRQYPISTALASLLKKTDTIMAEHAQHVESGFTDAIRKHFVDQLGHAGEEYRIKVYFQPATDKETVTTEAITQFFENCQAYFKATIKNNKNTDGLYHAYNLIAFDEDVLRVQRLYGMLEGQVAVLSTGLLSTKETADLLDNLKASQIYREDQYSYMLYPNRELPGFLERNNIPSEFIASSKLARRMLLDEDTRILYSDADGVSHFSRNFHNANDLSAALHDVKTSYPDLVDAEFQDFLDVFEHIFNHSAFTGRSGTFYGYEGLGSIYWHMVSKLLLAVQENIVMAEEQSTARGRLIDHYYEIRAGIGAHKAPDLYGSFPFDPYSHTPWGKGVQQPGMTGQVKEDVINRWAELGVVVSGGALQFIPGILNPAEYLKESGEFRYVDIHGREQTIPLHENQLAFTYCQVPVIYDASKGESIHVFFTDGHDQLLESSGLPVDLSSQIFMRSGSILRIMVGTARV